MSMTNLEKYKGIFLESLNVEEKELEELEYQAVPEWDSVALEDAFGIMLDTDDIIDLSSYKKGIEILKKYKIEI